jgi:tyrosyl-tRNA synthetase
VKGREEGEVERQLAVMRAGTVDFFGEAELRDTLRAALGEARPLRVKLGMDPSAPDLHLGHTVVLQKLKRIQELGHTPIFLVGDFTATIGDPSGRKKTRPALTPEEVSANASTYVEQVGKILDVERCEVRFNSEWMRPMASAQIVELCSHHTVARLLERDDFAKRYAAGDPISVHEFLYPFVQAYDSVALHADIELGGTDQTFNLLMAREIQRDYGQPPQAVITHPLLVGTDGRDKMSKSLDNTIGISEAPEEIYGKTMSISDSLMLEYFDRLSAGEWEDLASQREKLGRGQGDPLGFKNELARRIVERFHSADAADAAAEHFQRVIRRKETPDDLDEVAVPLEDGDALGLLDLLVRLGFARSTSEGRRLVGQNAVSISGETVRDPALRLGAGAYLLKVGKRRFARGRLS